MIVYKTTNLINGKIYIGSDQNENDEYLGSGVLLKKALEKYGTENFKKEVLFKTKNLKRLMEMETKLIREYNSTDRSIGYNISNGYWGGDTLTNHPDIDSIKEKISVGVINANERIQESKRKYFETESIEKRNCRISNVKKAMANADFSYFKTDEYKKNVSKGLKESKKFQEYCNNRGKRGKYNVIDKSNERYNQLIEFIHDHSFCEAVSKKDHTTFAYTLNVGVCLSKSHYDKSYQYIVRSLLAYVLWNTRNNNILLFSDLENKYNRLIDSYKGNVKCIKLKRIINAVLDNHYKGRPENLRILNSDWMAVMIKN